MENIDRLAKETEVIELSVYNIEQFLALEIPPKAQLLAPILQEQSLAMLFAKRGIGKTHTALGIAYAVASGGKFLRWDAPAPRKVLYIDGEMSAATMQQRIAEIVKKAEKEAASENFRIITPDMQEIGMPDLSTDEGQRRIEPYIGDADLIVVDNLSTLARSGKENEAEGWAPVQAWGLEMRRKGKSVLFVHHAGKGGQQRGTSRREDVLDLVIRLENPADYSPEQAARFEVHFDKARHLIGADAKPFEAQLTYFGWTVRDLEDVELRKMLELKSEGLSFAEIAIEMNIPKSTVHRRIKKYNEGVPSSQSHAVGQWDDTDINGTAVGQGVGR